MSGVRYLLFAIVFSLILLNVMWTKTYLRIRQLPMFHNKRLNENVFVSNGIYWSDLAESFVPKGLTLNESIQIIRKYHGQLVKNLTRDFDFPKNPRRKSNACIAFDDGTKFYVKYRRDALTYAEVFYFYYTRLLQIDNVPPVFLHSTNASSVFWKEVRVNDLNWNQRENKSVCVIYMVNNIRKLKRIPKIIVEAFASGNPVTGHSIELFSMSHKNLDYVAEIIQLGSMVLIDYVALHTDRYFRWDVFAEEYQLLSMMPKNIFKARNGKLWNIDNEGSFFGSYFLFDRRRRMLLKKIYDKLFKSICVFQKSLVNSLESIPDMSSRDLFLKYYKTNEPMVGYFVGRRINKLQNIFKHRFEIVLRWIRYCESMVSFKE